MTIGEVTILPDIQEVRITMDTDSTQLCGLSKAAETISETSQTRQTTQSAVLSRLVIFCSHL